MMLTSSGDRESSYEAATVVSPHIMIETFMNRILLDL